MTENCSALEALLFASGEPVPTARLSLILELSDEDVQEAANELSDTLDSSGQGICLVRIGDKLQLCSRPEYGNLVAKVLEQRKPPMLSQSALETVAIVAYFQPVTIAQVNKIRGVDSSYTISSLVDKGLIEIKGKLDAPGRPSLYGTTDVFLRTMRISDISELPELPDLTNVEGISKLQEKIDALQNKDVPLVSEDGVTLFDMNGQEKTEDGE